MSYNQNPYHHTNINNNNSIPQKQQQQQQQTIFGNLDKNNNLLSNSININTMGIDDELYEPQQSHSSYHLITPQFDLFNTLKQEQREQEQNSYSNIPTNSPILDQTQQIHKISTPSIKMKRIESQVDQMMNEITNCDIFGTRSLSTTSSTPHEKVKDSKINLKLKTNKLYHISSKQSQAKIHFRDEHELENESSYVYIYIYLDVNML